MLELIEYDRMIYQWVTGMETWPPNSKVYEVYEPAISCETRKEVMDQGTLSMRSMLKDSPS